MTPEQNHVWRARRALTLYEAARASGDSDEALMALVEAQRCIADAIEAFRPPPPEAA